LKKITVDFETFSEAPIRRTGVRRYAADPSTDIICMAYKIDEKPAKLWVPGDDVPKWILNKAWEQDNVTVEAHNAAMEQAVFESVAGPKYGFNVPPLKAWRCSSAKAAAHALPRKLEEVAKALACKKQKDMEGHRSMMKLAKPRKPTKNNPATRWTKESSPEDFAKTYAYCKDDVETEHEFSSMLRDLSPKEQRLWFLDQKLNKRGLYVDRKAITGALKIIAEYEERWNAKITSLTDGAVERATQLPRIKKWMEAQGVNSEKMDKLAIEMLLLRPDLPKRVRKVLKIRQLLSKTSTKKLIAMLSAVGKDGRIRDLLMFHGALTGRWSGKLIQIQNFPRGRQKDTPQLIMLLRIGSLEFMESQIEALTDLGLIKGTDPMDLISACLRSIIMAAPGNCLYVADYSQIEARAVAWLAGEKGMLKAFANDDPIYEEMARVIFGLKSIKDVTEDQRQVGKQAVLGCGYGMGAVKFQATCEKFGMKVSMDLAERAVETYRKINTRIVGMWYAQEDAAIKAMRTRRVVKCGKIAWLKKGRFLQCKLPSGRIISYYMPKLELGVTPWGEEKLQLSYMGTDSKTKKFVRIRTYGGKIVENITQGTARDIMRDAMLRLDKRKYFSAGGFTVHDEVVAETKKDYGSLTEFLAILTKPPKWGPDIPVRATGWTGERYKK